MRVGGFALGHPKRYWFFCKGWAWSFAGKISTPHKITAWDPLTILSCNEPPICTQPIHVAFYLLIRKSLAPAPQEDLSCIGWRQQPLAIMVGSRQWRDEVDLLNVRGRIYFIFNLLKYLVRKYRPNMSSAHISSPLQAGWTEKYNSIQSLCWSVPPSTSISTPYVTLRQPFPLPDDKRRFGYGHGHDIVQQRHQDSHFHFRTTRGGFGVAMAKHCLAD